MSSKAPLRVMRLTKRNFWRTVRALRGGRAIDPEVERKARKIVSDVASKGDRALINYSYLFDHVRLRRQELLIKEEEFDEAYSKVSEEQISAIRFVKRRIERVERELLGSLEKAFSYGGMLIRRSARPVESVGCYVPGGKAAYPSSLLMTVVPAKVAGVPRVVVASPPSRSKKENPLLLVTADMCGVDEFYRVGGAQAIAALAYGTETIRPVDKVVGPGNKYVVAAKLIVSGRVAIDAPAGPTEVLILADKGSNIKSIVLDLISQAEHGEDSVCGLVTDSEDVAKSTLSLLSRSLNSIKRKDIVLKALSRRGFILVSEDLDQAVKFVNAFAPEHLEILTANPEEIAREVSSAGLILLGDHSPVSASDYCVGTNHVLPTGGFARSHSGLSVLDFVKSINIVKCTRAALKSISGYVRILAEAEGLPNHALAVEGRLRPSGP